jgi:pimeloyl-ACP methyl ester carboxylesterase
MGGRRGLRVIGLLGAFALVLGGAVAGSAISASAARSSPPSQFPATAAQEVCTSALRVVSPCGDPVPLRLVRTTAARSSPLVWSPCSGGAQCATLRVPLDYAHPNGTQINLALERVLATDPSHRIGSLLVNPGGPGATGRTLPLDLRQAAIAAGGSAAQVFARFDVVGFDTRGVGASTPAIDCGNATDQYQQADFAPHTTQQQRLLIAATRSFVQACVQHTGELLRFVDTTSVVRDMDQIRSALGDPTLNYLGFSYGTALGAAYAHLFPNHIRTMVLDSAVDPNTILDSVASTSQQARDLDRAFQAFARDCAARPDCAFYSGGDPVGAFDRLIASLANKPLPAQSQPGRTVTQYEVVSTVALALGSLPASGPAIEAALAQAQRGDGSIFAKVFDVLFERGVVGRTNSLEANTVIDCIDQRGPRGTAGYSALITRIQAQEPRFGQAFISGELPCAYWPVKPKPPQLSVKASAPPILVVGSTGDPLVGSEGSRAMAKSIRSSVLLTRTGAGHGSYLTSSNQCINDAASNYLLSDSPPARGTTC